MRFPAVAGRFYPSDVKELQNLMNVFFTESNKFCNGITSLTNPEYPIYEHQEKGKRRIKAVISPHAGYLASGSIASNTFQCIYEDGLPDVYVVIGPDHYGLASRYGATTCSEPYLTPFGECKTDLEIIESISNVIPDVPETHRKEHSIEVITPFLQAIDPNPNIVPIMICDQSLEAVKMISESIKEAIKGKDAVIIASSDLCHYIPWEEEVKTDSQFLAKACACDINSMYDIVKKGASICGYGAIATAILSSGATNGSVVDFRNSWDTLHIDRNAVVGYASVIFQ